MVLRRLNVSPLSSYPLSFSCLSCQYEGERDLKTTLDFISGGGQIKGASSTAAGLAESEDDDDDLSDTKPSKRKTSGTRSRPARTTPNVSIFNPLRLIAPVPHETSGSLDGQSPCLPQCQSSNNSIISRVSPPLLWILNE